MARRNVRPVPVAIPASPPANISMAIAFARGACVSLGAVENPHPGRAQQNFDRFCEAQECLAAALNIVRFHKRQWAGKL